MVVDRHTKFGSRQTNPQVPTSTWADSRMLSIRGSTQWGARMLCGQVVTTRDKSWVISCNSVLTFSNRMPVKIKVGDFEGTFIVKFISGLFLHLKKQLELFYVTALKHAF